MSAIWKLNGNAPSHSCFSTIPLCFYPIAQVGGKKHSMLFFSFFFNPRKCYFPWVDPSSTTLTVSSCTVPSVPATQKSQKYWWKVRAVCWSNRPQRVVASTHWFGLFWAAVWMMKCVYCTPETTWRDLCLRSGGTCAWLLSRSPCSFEEFSLSVPTGSQIALCHGCS